MLICFSGLCHREKLLRVEFDRCDQMLKGAEPSFQPDLKVRKRISSPIQEDLRKDSAAGPRPRGIETLTQARADTTAFGRLHYTAPAFGAHDRRRIAENHGG